MKRFFAGLMLLIVMTSSVWGDIIDYGIPISADAVLVFRLQGEPKFHPGNTFTLNHHLGTLHFSTRSLVNRVEVPSVEALYGRHFGKAKDAEGAMLAARFALKHGLLKQFYQAVIKALEFDSQHPDACRIRDLKRTIIKDLGSSSHEEGQLRQFVRRANMKIKTSRHFILLHDTPDEPPELFSKLARPRPPRAEERLELLEKVYESFLLKFYSQGIELEIPKQRLMVVLFNEHQDYLDFATSLAPELASTSGFYDPRNNISFFFDHGTSEHRRPLREMASRLQAQLPQLRKAKAGEAVRFAETMSMLVAIDQENSDIEVVSHEATHQMAGNTGLFPRHVLVPRWVHEGLATYFEAPDDATWSGMGAVNDERLAWYRALASHREYSSLDFIVGDQIFTYALSGGAIQHAYGQAWALTHFLVENHFSDLMKFYKRLGQMPPDITLSPEVLNKLFDEQFSTERKLLEDEWRSYMRSLKTDMETVFAKN